jgi:hypothetical protein
MTVLEDEAAQLKGVSNVTQCLGNVNMDVSLAQFYETMIKGGEMISNLPLRTTSFHFCYNNIGMEFVLSGFRSFFGKFLRLRTRAHFGTTLYCFCVLVLF